MDASQAKGESRITDEDVAGLWKARELAELACDMHKE
jgi:hypothetical protein